MTNFPAPVRGWVETESLAMDRPGTARSLENWFPLQTGVRVRGGSRKAATIGSSAVLSLFSYETALASKLFAASASAIYDVSALDPDTPPAASVSGQTGGYYSTTQFGTVGGDYLYAVNGADEAQLYDGTTWSAVNGVSAIAITGVSTDALSFVWAHRNRLWFVEGGTANAWYLPVDQVGGAAQSVSLAGIFQDGGELYFGGTWSIDAGDGADDRIAFFSTKGQVAIYQGGNPADVNDWALVGVYDITRPLGPNATFKAGGDLVVATEEGAVPLSQVVNKDPAALSLAAVSKNIEQSWQSLASSSSQPWDMMKWARKNMALVAIPDAENECFVVNVETGAWSRFTGWDTLCLGQLNGLAFFGTSDGRIMEAESGGTDDGGIFVARCSWWPADMGRPGAYKSFEEARAALMTSNLVKVRLSATTDYRDSFPPAPDATTGLTDGFLWGTGLWGSGIWAGATSIADRSVVVTGWQSLGKSGFKVAPQVQITSDGDFALDVELVELAVTAVEGELVV